MSETNSNTRGRGRGRGRGGPRGRGAVPSSSSSAIPSGSVSKIKAQLRQTKRLLSKEDLNPDVRVTSERRLAALEDELVKAEKGLLEKKMVTKYRGIKFFERQKVLRRIKQAKKQLEQDASSESTKEQLKLARMDLYYILRYPKTEKYLALYPENSYIPFTPTPPSPPSSSSITLSDPSSSKSPSSSTTTKPKAFESDKKRWELRNDVLKKVESGEWNEESERGDLGIEGEEDATNDVEGSAVVGEKRSREVDDEGEKVAVVEADEEEEDSSTPAKKRKVEEEANQDTLGEEKEEAKEEETTVGEDGEPKKLNRKQKKALRRAQEAAGEIPTPSTAESASSPKKTEKVTVPTAGKGAGVKKVQNEKKKDVAPASKAEKLALEDDFFA